MTRTRSAPSAPVVAAEAAPVAAAAGATPGRRAVRRPAPTASGAGPSAVVSLGAEQDGIRTPTPDDLLAVMGELHALVAAENAALARGLPACAVEEVARKEHLSTLFRVFSRHLLRRGAAPLPAGELDALQAAAVALRALTAENATRLTAALEASRQRVTVVMDVLRRQVAAEQLTYGPRAGLRPPRGHCVEFRRSTEA